MINKRINRRTYLKSLGIGSLSALIGVSGFPLHVFAQEPTWSVDGLTSLPMRAMPSVELDSWMIALTEKPSDSAKALVAKEIEERIVAIARRARSQRELFNGLLTFRKSVLLNTAKEHLSFATGLFDARYALRLNSQLSVNVRHERITLLEFLAEETLLIAGMKYPTDIKEYVRRFSELSPQVKSAVGVSQIRGLEVASGDVVLSKFSGTGSSSFIALFTENPSLFSHSAVIYIDKATGQMLSPEAFIEDGVKLRSLEESYVKGSKTRMFIYRAKDVLPSTDAARIAAARGVEDFVEEMRKRVKDPSVEAAFPYNFSMDPAKRGEAFTCVGTALETYDRGGLKDNLNPYPPAVWSRFDPAHSKVFAEFLEMHAPRFPAPGDLDLNSQYELTGLRIDVEKLEQERIEMAAIDALFTVVGKKNSELRKLLAVFDDLGTQQISEQQLKFVQKLEFIPIETRKMITEQVPPNINLKQLVFFGYLNSVFTPKIRDAIMTETKAFRQQKGRPPGLGELRAIAAKHVVGHVDEMKKIAIEFAKRAVTK